jgi:hypothetical protein
MQTHISKRFMCCSWPLFDLKSNKSSVISAEKSAEKCAKKIVLRNECDNFARVNDYLYRGILWRGYRIDLFPLFIRHGHFTHRVLLDGGTPILPEPLASVMAIFATSKAPSTHHICAKKILFDMGIASV